TSIINSGYTGTNGKLEATLLHRSQWVGIDGAPNTQTLTVNGRVGEKIGLGVSFMNDNLGASNNIDINGLFAYEITTGYSTKLSLGLNVGLDILDVDWSKGSYNNDMDPIFRENINSIRPMLGVGAFFYSTKWYMGASTRMVLNSEIYNDNDRIVTDRKTHYYLIGGYVFDLSESLKFKPAFMTKHVGGSPITFDISSNFLINEKLSLGASYRYDDAISALAGFHISKSFFIGYAYDYSLTALENYNDGSHEIILKYNVFDINKRALSPRFF